jgi:nitroimidazol reductase NimA-like FMN-containing flavoprotein (pyridoxamine 5'-phosphate oxidase superfamily)
MFRQMRRSRQQLSAEEAAGVLERGKYGVLALSGDGGYPYAVPVSYVYAGGKIFFHSALTGHKVDSVRRDDKASFCVVDRNELCPATFTTHYRSAIAFGRVRILENEDERRAALTLIAKKYGPEGDAEGCAREVDATLDRACLVEFTVEHLTGKQAKELVNKQV